MEGQDSSLLVRLTIDDIKALSSAANLEEWFDKTCGSGAVSTALELATTGNLSNHAKRIDDAKTQMKRLVCDKLKAAHDAITAIEETKAKFEILRQSSADLGEFIETSKKEADDLYASVSKIAGDLSNSSAILECLKAEKLGYTEWKEFASLLPSEGYLRAVNNFGNPEDSPGNGGSRAADASRTTFLQRNAIPMLPKYMKSRPIPLKVPKTVEPAELEKARQRVHEYESSSQKGMGAVAEYECRCSACVDAPGTHGSGYSLTFGVLFMNAQGRFDDEIIECTYRTNRVSDFAPAPLGDYVGTPPQKPLHWHRLEKNPVTSTGMASIVYKTWGYQGLYYGFGPNADAIVQDADAETLAEMLQQDGASHGYPFQFFLFQRNAMITRDGAAVPNPEHKLFIAVPQEYFAVSLFEGILDGFEFRGGIIGNRERLCKHTCVPMFGIYGFDENEEPRLLDTNSSSYPWGIKVFKSLYYPEVLSERSVMKRICETCGVRVSENENPDVSRARLAAHLRCTVDDFEIKNLYYDAEVMEFARDLRKRFNVSKRKR